MKSNNPYSRSTLHLAVENGKIEEIRKLLAAEAKKDINQQDNIKRMPLHTAVGRMAEAEDSEKKQTYTAIVKLLLEHGANPFMVAGSDEVGCQEGAPIHIKEVRSIFRPIGKAFIEKLNTEIKKVHSTGSIERVQQLYAYYPCAEDTIAYGEGWLIKPEEHPAVVATVNVSLNYHQPLLNIVLPKKKVSTRLLPLPLRA